MKWNYDETLARTHLQEYKSAVKKENDWREKTNKRTVFLFSLWVIGTVVVATTLIFLICFLIPADDSGVINKNLCIATVCYFALVIFIFVILYLRNDYYVFLDDKTQESWRIIPADVKYLLATDGKNVLSYKCKFSTEGLASVYVDLEDENHIVSRCFVVNLEKKISTAVSEEFADVTNGVFLIPYSAHDEKM